MYLILLCIVCIFGYYVSKRKYKKGKFLPVYPGRLPIIGHIHLYFGQDRKDTWDFYKQVTEECMKQGGLMTLSIGPEDFINPDDAVTLANLCPEKHEFYKFLKPWLGEGLVTASAKTHKRTRKIMNSAFTHQVLVGLLGVFNFQGQQLTNHLDTQVGKLFNPEHVLLTNNLETICKTSLGVDAKHHNVLFNEYVKALKAIFISIFERLHKFWLHVDIIFYYSEHKRKQDEILKTVHKLSTTVLQKRKTEIIEARHSNEKLSDNFRPLLDTVIEMSIDQGLLSEKEMRAELDTVLLGGHDTTAATLNYALVLLGSNPCVQDKAYNEVIEVMGDIYRDVDKLDIPNLVFLECVIKETLRLFPLAPALLRAAHTDVKLKNYMVPSGSSIVISPWGIHRHRMWGEDPEQFRPERWLQPDILPSFNKAFIGFGAGKRTCIGKSYAMMSMKTSLVNLLRKYRVSADASKLTLRMDMLLKPQSGHEIKLELRKQKTIS